MPPSSRQVIRPAAYIRSLSTATSMHMRKLVWFGSESLPTLALFTFLVLQFLFNVIRFLPVRSLKLWVDRSRLLWKILLDRDFRVEHIELETLRQRVADGDSKYARIEKDLEVSKSNSLQLRERIITQTQQLESERQNNARELERLRNQLESQAKLLEETEAHLDELRASSNRRLSRTGDEFNISVYHSRITALETRLDQLEGENEETEVRYREVLAENTALRDQLTEVEALKTEAHSLIQEMRSRLVAAEAHSQEFSKEQVELQALVQVLEAEKEGLLQAKKVAEEHEEHEIEHEKSKHAQQVESLMLEMDSLRARYEEVDGLAIRLRSQLDALSNEHADLKAKVEKEHTTDQDTISDSTQRIQELEKALKDETAKSEGLQREINLKDDELTNLREILDDVDVKRARLHKARRPQQPTPPHTLSAASALHPANLFGSVSSGLPSHPRVPTASASESGHVKQRSVSGSSISGSIKGKDKEHELPAPSTETPPSPESPPAIKAKRSKRQRLSSLLGVHMGHHHNHSNEDAGSTSGSGNGGSLGGIRQIS